MYRLGLKDCAAGVSKAKGLDRVEGLLGPACSTQAPLQTSQCHTKDKTRVLP